VGKKINSMSIALAICFIVVAGFFFFGSDFSVSLSSDSLLTQTKSGGFKGDLDDLDGVYSALKGKIPLQPKENMLDDGIHVDVLVEINEKISGNKANEKVEVLFQVNEDNFGLVQDKISSSGGEVKGSFKVGGVIVAEIPAKNVVEISKDVNSVWPDTQYSVLLDDSHDLIHTQVAWDANVTGKGIKIAILDTGIAEHEMFGDRIIAEKQFTFEGHTDDRHGHGTHVAGIAAGDGEYKGVAPGALLLNAKVLDDIGGGSSSRIIAGINWAVDPDNNTATDDGADILSLSLGAPISHDGVVIKALEDAIARGVIVVVAAGNCGEGCGGFYGVTTPGDMEAAITVGAYDSNKERAAFSSVQNFGAYIKPDVYAPGVDIISANVNGYVEKSGTSMATPFVSGVAALLKEVNPSLAHDDAKLLLSTVNVAKLFGVNISSNETTEDVEVEGYWVVVDDQDKKNVTCPDNYGGYDPGLGLTEKEFYFLFSNCREVIHKDEVELELVSNKLPNAFDHDKPIKTIVKLPRNLTRFIPKMNLTLDKEELLSQINIADYSAPTNITAQRSFSLKFTDDYTHRGSSSDGVVWGGGDLTVELEGTNILGNSITSEAICYDWQNDGTMDICYAESYDDFLNCVVESEELLDYCLDGKCWDGYGAGDDFGIGTASQGDRFRGEIAVEYFGDCNSYYSYDHYSSARAYYVVSPRQYHCVEDDKFKDYAWYTNGYALRLNEQECGANKICDSDSDGLGADFGSDGLDEPDSPCRYLDGTGNCGDDDDCLSGSHCSFRVGWDYCCPNGKEWRNGACRNVCDTSEPIMKVCDDHTPVWTYQTEACAPYEIRQNECLSSELCIAGECRVKTCEDYSGNYGDCNSGYKREDNTVFSCEDVETGTGEVNCWVSISVLGDADYCDKIDCDYGGFDCDNHWDCESSICVGESSFECGIGQECGCCAYGELWDKHTNTCEQRCGNGLCDYGETGQTCARDCYPDFEISEITNVNPPVASAKSLVNFSARVKNKGGAAGGIYIEGGVVPTEWTGTVYPADYRDTQVIDNYFPVCPENDYYQSKWIELGVGDEALVNFTVISPDNETVDACDEDGPKRIAWGDSFKIIAGTYKELTGGDYVDFNFKDYVVENTCEYPFGSSEDCYCRSDAHCEEFDENTKCSRTQGYPTCIDKVKTSTCGEVDDVKCKLNIPYRCADHGTYLSWSALPGCNSRQYCSETSGECIPKGDYDLIIDYAPESVFVNAVQGTLLKISIDISGNVDPSLVFEYDVSEFDHFSGDCVNLEQGHNECYLEVLPSSGEYKFSYGDDSQHINAVGNDLTVVYLTDIQHLKNRYDSDRGFNLLLSKLYLESANNNGVVIDLGTQFLDTSDYQYSHPFDFNFTYYKENKFKPTYTDNSYADQVGHFIHKRLSNSKNVVIVGDDYVVPHRRDKYQLRAGLIPDFIKTFYGKIVSGISVMDQFHPFALDKNSLADSDPIIESTMFTDQQIILREVSYNYSSVDLIFSHDDAARGDQIKLILPDDIGPEMNTSITNLKQRLIQEGLAEDEYSFEELLGSKVACNDFTKFADFPILSSIDVPIIIGTLKTNPAINCYPVYKNEDYIDTVSIEPSMWNNNGAILINTDNSEIIDDFSNHIIKGKKYRDLHGRSYMYIHDAIQVGGYVGLILIPFTFGASAVGPASLASILFRIDLSVAALEGADVCLYRYGELPNSAGGWFSCVATAAPVVAYGAGRGFAELRVGRLYKAANKVDISGDLQRLLNKFLSSSPDAKYALKRIPRDKYEDFLYMLRNGMQHETSEIGRQFGSKFGEKLTYVLMNSNIKRSAFKNKRLMGLIGGAVTKNMGSSDKALRRLGDIIAHDNAEQLLDLIVKSNTKWNKPDLDKLLQSSKKSLQNINNLLDAGDLVDISAKKLTRLVKLNSLTHLEQGPVGILRVISQPTRGAANKAYLIEDSVGKQFYVKSSHGPGLYAQDNVRDKLYHNLLAYLNGQRKSKGRHVIPKSRFYDDLVLVNPDGSTLDPIRSLVIEKIDGFDYYELINGIKSKDPSVSLDDILLKFPKQIQDSFERDFVMNLLTAQTDANAGGYLLEGMGNNVRAITDQIGPKSFDEISFSGFKKVVSIDKGRAMRDVDPAFTRELTAQTWKDLFDLRPNRIMDQPQYAGIELLLVESEMDVLLKLGDDVDTLRNLDLDIDDFKALSSNHETLYGESGQWVSESKLIDDIADVLLGDMGRNNGRISNLVRSYDDRILQVSKVAEILINNFGSGRVKNLYKYYNNQFGSGFHKVLEQAAIHGASNINDFFLFLEKSDTKSLMSKISDEKQLSVIAEIFARKGDSEVTKYSIKAISNIKSFKIKDPTGKSISYTKNAIADSMDKARWAKSLDEGLTSTKLVFVDVHKDLISIINRGEKYGMDGRLFLADPAYLTDLDLNKWTDVQKLLARLGLKPNLFKKGQKISLVEISVSDLQNIRMPSASDVSRYPVGIPEIGITVGAVPERVVDPMLINRDWITNYKPK
jgi:subtilisin family serine protease